MKIAEGEIKVSEKPTKGSTFLTEEELDALRRGGTPKAGELSEFDARRYHEATSSGAGKVGDGLTGDHIPSRAALVERWKLDNPGKPVPEELINRDGVTVVLKGTDHATLSRTYAGRNTAEQILEDARDLGKAFGRDANAIMSGLQRDNRLTLEVVGAYQKAYNLNVAKGVFSPHATVRLICDMRPRRLVVDGLGARPRPVRPRKSRRTERLSRDVSPRPRPPPQPDRGRRHARRLLRRWRMGISRCCIRALATRPSSDQRAHAPRFSGLQEPSGAALTPDRKLSTVAT